MSIWGRERRVYDSHRCFLIVSIAAGPHIHSISFFCMGGFMSVLDILIGKPLATYEEGGEQIGVSAGIPIFGLDALSSAAYGPEAALTLLIVLGSAGTGYIVPVSLSIIA